MKIQKILVDIEPSLIQPNREELAVRVEVWMFGEPKPYSMIKTIKESDFLTHFEQMMHLLTQSILVEVRKLEEEKESP